MKMDQCLFAIKNIQTLAEIFMLKDGMPPRLFEINFWSERKPSQPYATK